MGTRVAIGRFGAPHGVRGLIVVRSFTQVPEDVAAYGPVTTGDGRVLRIAVRSAKKAGLIVEVDGISSREEAAALTGLDLYVDRSELPETDPGEYYHADLVGLAAEDRSGNPLGRVVAIQDFGAGDIVEIDTGTGETVLLPFTVEIVPEVDIGGGRIVVAPPEGSFAEEGKPA